MLFLEAMERNHLKDGHGGQNEEPSLMARDRHQQLGGTHHEN
jgi:hypothetical protein